ncbi:MAG: glucose-1-phosphate adenylyltransferase subunit GlgD [Peptoniphilaceae bacterium]|nr:glucose-1-phosphate adenylyltransferase subunit GlgD [Peptoniphilaceae bacterium]MDY6018030.1 glucose-1-phosphate adenylyltransferase subunit GlgD [Anaerococcus sp.]
MQNIVALIYSSEYEESNYDSLCKVRPDYMLPFAGRYRIIDFALSNISNYNITSVVLYAGLNIRSTLDHVGNGRNWELNRRMGGLKIYPSIYNKMDSNSEIETYFSSMKFFEDSNREYVYITNPMYITKVDISDAYETMISENLDCLVFSKKVKDDYGFYLNRRIINLDEEGEAIGVGINLGLQDEIELFTGSILIKKSIFMDLLRYSIEKNNADTVLEAIFKYPKEIITGLYRSSSTLQVIQDTLSYYDANRKLLDRDYFNELFYENGMVYTKSKDEPSTEYTKDSVVKNSLIANGAIIQGHVEDSIIFRGVTVKKGAVVKNSIVFQGTIVGEGSILNNVITDKDTIIGDHIHLFGNRIHPFLTEKGEHIN